MTTLPAADAAVSDAGSAWAPLRLAAFRALWLAQLGTLIGTWMQTVGAQWLLIDEPNAPTLVSLVQTASLLPMLLLALPAGVLADSFDRRRLLVGVQLVTLAVSVVLTLLAWVGEIPPAVLLALTGLLGCGQAMSMPPWQALIPDVAADEPVAGRVGAGRGEHEPRSSRRTGARWVLDHPGRRLVGVRDQHGVLRSDGAGGSAVGTVERHLGGCAGALRARPTGWGSVCAALACRASFDAAVGVVRPAR